MYPSKNALAVAHTENSYRENSRHFHTGPGFLSSWISSFTQVFPVELKLFILRFFIKKKRKGEIVWFTSPSSHRWFWKSVPVYTRDERFPPRPLSVNPYARFSREIRVMCPGADNDCVIVIGAEIQNEIRNANRRFDRENK